MKLSNLGRNLLLLACAGILLSSAPLLSARTKPNSDKYAHKIEKKLASEKKGALLRIVFTNDTESTGTLGELGERSFTLVNVETNAAETHQYIDVDSIQKGSNSIGKGSGSHHHRGPF